jgi:hypothetical protein
MHEAGSIVPGPVHRLGDGAFYAIAALIVFVGYLIVFSLMGNQPLFENVLASARNLLPLAILATAVRPILERQVMQRRPGIQIAAHICLGMVFSLLWYWMLMVLMGLSGGTSFTDFTVRAVFPTPAYAWQLLQGATFYALVAALTYLRAQPPFPTFVVTGPPTEADAPAAAISRYFIRQGDDIHPIDVSRIVSITGADDYAEVVTTEGRHLVRMTLAQFETTLPSGQFIRIHRSRIVNADRIMRAEPAGGGRMLLHMENGEIIQASRTGSKLLRERVI